MSPETAPPAPSSLSPAAASVARAPFLAVLPPEELEALAARGDRRVYDAGEELFGELEPGDSILVIVSGRVRISVAAGEPTERLLGEVGAGSALGEVGLLTGRVRSATATAVERSEALHLAREAVAELVTRFPQVASAFARILGERIAETDQALAQALRAEGAELAPVAAVRRAEVERRRGLGPALAAAFREVVLEHRAELPFFFLTGFLAALVTARIIVHVGLTSGHDPKALFRDLYVTGLLLLLATGGCAHFVFARNWRRALCAGLGAALGFLANELSVLLSFDVFYLDMTTRDVNATFSAADLYDRAATRYAVLIVVAVAVQATYLRGFYRRALFLVRERLRRRGGTP